MRPARQKWHYATRIAHKVLDGFPDMDRKLSIILTSAHAITRQWVDDIARMHPGLMINTDRGDTSDNIKVLRKK